MNALVLVRKLLHDLRWPLLIVKVLMAGFQCLWVKVTQRTVTAYVPATGTYALVLPRTGG